MEWTSLNDLRESYLRFFEAKDHLRRKSYPLIPANDKSLLLINAGMAPLKKYFTGEQEPLHTRMTTCQKCIRTPDIERVGVTARHGTFFEMLGNFSFGDYFKREATAWAWEYITQVLKLPVERLWVSIYENDDEAFDIWTKEVGVDAGHIVRLGKEDNFWEIGSGPCGPCSEIYFDRGEKYGCSSPDCAVGCDCDRFIEFWNLVFTQYDGDGAGNYTPLAKPNIDTGMGLERVACIMQDVNNLFEVDTIQRIMRAVIERAGVSYGADAKSDISLRVITDHIRSTCFLICDGVVPSNEGRGYVLRRLLRRAARHGRLLGIEGTFLSPLAAVVAAENTTEYPELTEKLGYIQKIIGIEEEKFSRTIDSGLDTLNGMLDAVGEAGTLSGADAFTLSDRLGFPIDLTREIAAERGFAVDEDEYARLLGEQKKRAREARAESGDFGWSEDSLDFLDKTSKTVFTGYTDTESESTVCAIINAETSEAVGKAEGGEVIVVLDKTPFYGEGGGQVGDTGTISSAGAELIVKDTKKTHDGIYLHICELRGELSVGDTVTARIDTERRDSIKRNHSAAHLLQAALRRVLGSHVEQSGSYVDSERVRFDFTHYTAMTGKEIEAVEASVNEEILRAEEIVTIQTDIETARTMGAIALFGEKYSSVVRLVKMGDYSAELCGGTHLDNTAKAGLFKITYEGSVAAGIRRIEGTTGVGVLKLISQKDALISACARELKASNVYELDKKAAQLQTELKNARHETEALSAKLASAKLQDICKNARRTGEFNVITGSVEELSADAVRTVCDRIKSSDEDAVAVIAVSNGGKHNIIACAGERAVKNGADAGAILRQISKIAGGGGGGRPDSAVSGVKTAEKIPEALMAVYDILNKI